MSGRPSSIHQPSTVAASVVKVKYQVDDRGGVAATLSGVDLFRAALRAWASGFVESAPVAHELAAGLTMVVLVEGVSDQRAVEALAARRGRDLTREGVCVVPMGGAMGVARFLGLFGARGLALDVRGLCDEAEVGYFRRGLEQAGRGAHLTRPAMEALGFHVCVADLE